MNKYRWSCQNCEVANEPEADKCASCNCPASLSRHELNEWRSGKAQIPTKPSLMGYNIYGPFYWLYEKLAPCPSCNLLMHVRHRQCPHCGHKLTDIEHEYQKIHDENVKSYGLRQGAIWTPLIFIGLLAIFWVAGA